VRGIIADLVIVDETAYVSEEFLKEMIMPLFEVSSTALICISTPETKSNLFAQLATLRTPDDSRPLFNVEKIELVCSACAQTAHPENCTHNLHLLPRWKSRSKFAMGGKLLGGRADLRMRESMGVTIDTSKPAFDAAAIADFAASIWRVPAALTQDVIIACDPNAGGSSAMALCAAVFVAGTMMVSEPDRHHVLRAHHAHKALDPRESVVEVRARGRQDGDDEVFEQVRARARAEPLRDPRREGRQRVECPHDARMGGDVVAVVVAVGGGHEPRDARRQRRRRGVGCGRGGRLRARGKQLPLDPRRGGILHTPRDPAQHVAPEARLPRHEGAQDGIRARRRAQQRVAGLF
jgi:hypothetical protein